MGVFSKMKDFISRHRTKFVVGGVIVTGSILLTRYAQQKLREWQEQEAKEFLDRTRKQQHFESTERTCNQTILSLMSALKESLNKIMDTEGLIVKLRNKPENKLELWEQLKILVFTRISCMIYVTVVLVVALRIQLNILGGYLFKEPIAISTEVQQKYLSLCNHLLDDGLMKLKTIIEKEYDKILGNLELNKQLKLNDLENIFWAIQSTVSTSEDNPIEKLSRFIIPDVEATQSVYNDMLNDTADLLDSDEVKSVTVHCINRSFTLLNDQLAEFFTPNDGAFNGGFVHPSEVSIPLAKLIPIINGLYSKKLSEGLVQQLLSNEKLNSLGANVYECFSN